METTPSPADDNADPEATVPDIKTEPATTASAQMLFGRYRVVRELGRGGMGQVVLAHDTKLDIRVAVKVLPPRVANDPEAVKQLKKEVLRGMALTHPGIARTHNFEQDETSAGIVMEYVDGPTLATLKSDQIEGCFAPEDIEEWIGQLCAVLDYAHREARIVHRDLKPNNILLGRPEADSPRGRIKVADFGLATTINSSAAKHSCEGITSGTPPYMSPQQARGQRPTHLDDVYSLGATIYDLLTGNPPFYQGNIVMQVEQVVPPLMEDRRLERGILSRRTIPSAWENIVAACLAKDPSERPQSAGEVWQRLKYSEATTVGGSGMSGNDQTIEEESGINRRVSPRSGIWRQWPVWGAAVLIAVGTMAGFALHQHSHRPMHDLGTPAPVTGPLELIHAATAGAPFVNGIAMKFVPVPIFGVPATGTPVPVKVLFATTETTVAQYERFVVATKRDSPKPDFAQAPDHPAVNVSWEDAQAFCAWLTESELASKRLPPGAKYRLPTDHEWSCAVGIGDREDASRSPKVKRGAIEGVYPWGTRWPPPQGSGNYADEAAKKAGVGTVHIDNYDDGFDHTCPVEAFAPNALGIFGLGGNAAEWCEDWYDPAKKEVRTLRGGSWADGDELYLRSSFRAGAAPDERFVGYGFRCVLEALGPTDAPRENP